MLVLITDCLKSYSEAILGVVILIDFIAIMNYGKIGY